MGKVKEQFMEQRDLEAAKAAKQAPKELHDRLTLGWKNTKPTKAKEVRK